MASREEHISDEILSERLDGRLTLTEIRRIEAHLASCAECTARAHGLADVRSSLRALGTAPLPRDFRLEPAGRLDLPPQAGSAAHVQTLPGRMIGRVASAVVTMVGIVLLLGGISSLYSTAGTNHTSAADAFSPGSQSSTSNTMQPTGSTKQPNTSGGQNTPTTPTLGPITPSPTPTQVINGTAQSAHPSRSQPQPPINPAVPITTGTLAIVVGTLGLRRARPKRP